MLASLVLTNGHVYTMETGRPAATAVAITGDKILAAGNDDQIKELLAPGGEWIDLAGRCVTPGLVDAHVHFQSYSLSLQRVLLSGTRNLDEALSRLSEQVSDDSADRWLLGGGWSQSEWPAGQFPRASDLDRAAPHRPVALRHKSGHALWVNSRALRLAGITSDTPDPPGGQIQRDASGQPTGVLFEEAMDLVAENIPRPSEADIVAAMRQAQERCLQAGLTGIHDFDGRDCFRALQTLHQNRELRFRVVKNIPVYRLKHAIGVGLRSGFGDDWLRIGGVKIFADGALGPRTAAMIAPYDGEPENWGIIVTDKEEMMAYASQASANGLSLTIHAIGDRANHDVLDVFEALRLEEEEAARQASLAGEPYPVARRHRIEHAQILHPDDFQRLARLNIVASMQPIHATSDMEMADRYWGRRAKDSYAWRSVLNSGATLVFGSDAPVEPIEPLPGLHAAVTRRRLDGTPGPDGWYPDQRLSIVEAVTAFSLGAAVTSGRESRMGTIAPGKLADLTIFGRDIFAIPHGELLDVQIDGTIVGGDFKYRTW